jgi:glycerophosphoryl diester phosphodiesterase
MRTTILMALLVLYPLGLAYAAGDCQGLELHAHRGVASAPENSTEALVRALQDGFDAYETDIQLLKTGQWVLHHDLLTGRTVDTGTRANTTSLTDAQWSSARLLTRQNAATGTPPPFLADLLSASAPLLNQQRRANIEVKGKYSCDLVSAVYRQIARQLPTGSWFLTSVDQPTLSCLRQIDKHQYLGVIVAPELRDQALDARTHHITAKVDRALAHFGKGNMSERIVDQVEAKYNNSFNREFLSPGGLRTMKDRFGNVGLHVEVTSLTTELLRAAKDLAIPVFSYYTVGADKEHASRLSAIARQARLIPTGAIIDGNPDLFCSAFRAGL